MCVVPTFKMCHNFFFFFFFKHCESEKTALLCKGSLENNRGLQKSRKFRKCQKCEEIHQNGHSSAIWPPNENLRALSFLQLLKLEKRKCLYFLDFWPVGWDIAILSFYQYLSIWSQTKKLSKWQYLSPEATNLKNEGTLFSSTLKVEEKKVLSDFRLGAIWLRYGHFDVFLHIFYIF